MRPTRLPGALHVRAVRIAPVVLVLRYCARLRLIMRLAHLREALRAQAIRIVLAVFAPWHRAHPYPVRATNTVPAHSER
eukprot:10472818-Alexandrium_andersonii.AAC.1